MLKRKMLDKLIAWKQKAGGREALLIEGARRVGKSTIVEEFGRTQYKSYILIDSHVCRATFATSSKTSVMTLTHFSCCCLRITASDCTSVNR